MSLFEANHRANLIPQDGDLNDYGCILDLQAASLWFATLLEETPWQHDEVVVFGKRITTARKVAWYGDAPYYYSGALKQPLPWSDAMLALKTLVQTRTGHTFNSCLVNLYENGSQGVGWHSDDEAVLGANPLIASLSLGGTRRFDLRRKGGSRIEHSLTLGHGSLLVMAGATQHHWQHQVAKTRSPCAPRLNLTFRLVLPPS